MEGESSANSSSDKVGTAGAPKVIVQPVNGASVTAGADAKSPPKVEQASGDGGGSEASDSKDVGKSNRANIKKILAMMDSQEEEENQWSDFSVAEMKVLVREVELRREALFGDYKEGESPKYRWLIWQEVAEKVNEVNATVHRNLEQVRIKWFDYKDPVNKWERRIRKKPRFKHTTGMFFSRKAVLRRLGEEAECNQSSTGNKDGANLRKRVRFDLGEVEAKAIRLSPSMMNTDENVRMKGILSALNEDKATMAIKYLSHSTQRQGMALLHNKGMQKGGENKADGKSSDASKESHSSQKMDEGSTSSGVSPQKKAQYGGPKSDSSKDGDGTAPKEGGKPTIGMPKIAPKSLMEMVDFLTKITTDKSEDKESKSSTECERKSVAGVKRSAEDGTSPEPKRVMFGGTSADLHALLKAVDPTMVKQVKMKHPKTGKDVLVTKIIAPEAIKALGGKIPALVTKKVLKKSVVAKVATPSAAVVESSTKSDAAKVQEKVSADMPAEQGTGSVSIVKTPGKEIVTSKAGKCPEVGDGSGKGSADTPVKASSRDGTSSAGEAGNVTEVESGLDAVAGDVESELLKSAEKGKSVCVPVAAHILEEKSTSSGQKSDESKAESRDGSVPDKPLASVIQSKLKQVIQSGDKARVGEVENSTQGTKVTKESSPLPETPNKDAKINASDEKKTSATDSTSGTSPKTMAVKVESQSSALQPGDLVQQILKGVSSSVTASSSGKPGSNAIVKPGEVRMLNIGGKTVKVVLVKDEDYSKMVKNPSGGAVVSQLKNVTPVSVGAKLVSSSGQTSAAPTTVGFTTIAPSVGTIVTPSMVTKATPGAGTKTTPSLAPKLAPSVAPNVVTQMVPVVGSNVVPMVASNVFPVMSSNVVSVVGPNVISVVAPNVLPVVAPNVVPIAPMPSVVAVSGTILAAGTAGKSNMDMPFIEAAQEEGKAVKKVTPSLTVGDASQMKPAVVKVSTVPGKVSVHTSPVKQFKGFRGFPMTSSLPMGILSTPLGSFLTTSASSSPTVTVVSMPQMVVSTDTSSGSTSKMGPRKPNILSSGTKTVSSHSGTISIVSRQAVSNFGVKRVVPTNVQAGSSKLKVHVVKDESHCKELVEKQHPLVKAALSGKPIDFQEELRKMDPEEGRLKCEGSNTKKYGPASSSPSKASQDAKHVSSVDQRRGIPVSRPGSMPGVTKSQSGLASVNVTSSAVSSKDKWPTAGVPSSQIRVRSAESLQSIRIESPSALNKKISLSQIAVLNSSGGVGVGQSPTRGKRKQELVANTLGSDGATVSRPSHGKVIEEARVDVDDCIIVEEVGSRLLDPPEVFCVDSNDSYGVEVT